MTPLDSHTMTSPIGPLGLFGRGDQLVYLHLPGGKEPPPAGVENATPILRRAATQLAEYFAGARTEFALALAPEGTPFQQLVWAALRAIPYGATVSYGHIAHAIGRPAASRAVGAANGRNPISIIVPCHRVIGASGALTGYGGGLPAKGFLLEHERAHGPQLAMFSA
ncbi:methylated-DNA--[protein]-cysteine S-methyltransferase [soil metagenome]